MADKKVLLSVDDLYVKFRVRGRQLTAIRGISLDIYENESIAIVGESGSGKSVFTKTFAGMLDSNGYIPQGKIIFNDQDLADTTVKKDSKAMSMIAGTLKKLNEYSHLEHGAETYRAMLELESEKKQRGELNEEEEAAFAAVTSPSGSANTNCSFIESYFSFSLSSICTSYLELISSGICR